MKRRKWLKEKYPKGLGLSDIYKEMKILEKQIEKEKYNGPIEEVNSWRLELVARRRDLNNLLDYIAKFNETPEFSEDGNSIFLG